MGWFAPIFSLSGGLLSPHHALYGLGIDKFQILISLSYSCYACCLYCLLRINQVGEGR